VLLVGLAVILALVWSWLRSLRSQRGHLHPHYYSISTIFFKVLALIQHFLRLPGRCARANKLARVSASTSGQRLRTTSPGRYGYLVERRGEPVVQPAAA